MTGIIMPYWIVRLANFSPLVIDVGSRRKRADRRGSDEDAKEPIRKVFMLDIRA